MYASGTLAFVHVSTEPDYNSSEGVAKKLIQTTSVAHPGHRDYLRVQMVSPQYRSMALYSPCYIGIVSYVLKNVSHMTEVQLEYSHGWGSRYSNGRTFLCSTAFSSVVERPSGTPSACFLLEPSPHSLLDVDPPPSRYRAT